MGETALALVTTEPERHPLPGGERLESIIAAAAPFSERLDGALFEPSGDGREVFGRTSKWLRAAAADGESVRRLLARRAATGREVGAGLRSVRLCDPQRLPDWAQALVAFLEAQQAPAERPDATLAAFRRAADRLVDWSDGVLEGVELTPAAREDVARGLMTRLWYACEDALRFELRLAGREADWPEEADLDVSLAGWLARFDALPGLAYVVGLVCHQWRNSVTEIFARLRTDLPLLRRALWDGADPGPVAAFSGDAGDRHDDGRSVALLRFASGEGVVYKPKDLRHAVAFMDVVAFLNERLPLDLPTRTIVPRDGYGWEERAVAVACTEREGFARFYRRLGMLVRLVQLLEGRDLWADNLLAVGEHPVITDLECLLYPPVPPPPTLGSAHRQLLAAFEETVVRTGMVVQPWTPRTSLPVRDLGCLSHAGDEASLPLPPYRPWFGDELADPWRYGDEVVAGYREMQAVLLSQREELGAPGGPLARFEGADVRYIWRHTWDYQTIVRASTSPQALVDGVARETVLARILRDAYGSLGADRADLTELAEAELRALRRLDVPLFRSRTTSGSVFTTDGQEIPDHFLGTAWSRLQARVAGLPDFPLDEHVAVITACIDAARSGAETTPPPVPAHARLAAVDAPLGAEELLDVACQVGEAILDARLPAAGRSGWLSLSWYPVPDLYQVEVLSRDLLTGSGAVGVFLAELAALTGSPRYWTAARETLDDLVELVGGSFAFVSEVRLAGGAPVPGGFAGPGAALYALARSATRLGDSTLLDAARALVAPAAEVVRSGRACADVPFGSAGLLLNLLRLPRDPDLDALVRELAADALAALGDPAATFAPYAPTSRLGDLVPTGRDSVALALARTLAVAPDLVDDADAVRSAVASHPFDLRRRGGRLAASEVGLPARIAQVGAATPTCRELVAGGGEALAAGGRATADRLFGALVDRRRASGRWFGDRALDDRVNLSALDGLVAVGLLALGLYDAELAPLTLLR